MKSMMAIFATGLSTVALAAAMPTVSNVHLTQDANRRRVTISYDLADADAVVTVSLVTNGVEVSGAHLQGMQGDVAKVVAQGNGRQITWKPHKFWPEGGVIEGEIAARVTAWPVESPAPYMVVDLTGAKGHRFYETEEALPGGVSNSAYRTSQMVFRKILAATACYRAGSDAKESGRSANEALHYVTLTNDFYLAIFPMTQGQYLTIRGSGTTNPSSTIGDDLPVDNLSGCTIGFPYNSITDIGNNTMESLSLMYYARIKTAFDTMHVPTQAEWEFACRAGDNAVVYGGYTLGEVAWYADNSNGRLQPVGQKKPNAFGLYDMLGNVWERTRDSADRVAYTTEQFAPFYGTNSHGSYQAMCGGAFNSAATAVRPAKWAGGSDWQTHNRGYTAPGFGLRLKVPLK